jgi:integrase
MAKREQKKLDHLFVRHEDEPGRYGDGGNLFLVVGKSGSKKWTFLYRRQGKLTEIGLGSLVDVSLAKARDKAVAARSLLDAGTDPLDAKRATEKAAIAVPAFGAFALELVDTIEGGFRNSKHRAQWRATLQTYCKPIWNTPIDRVDTAGVLTCLTPIWQSKPETAARVRGRIERVLDAAKARGLRAGENPALWRGHLSATLPRRKKLSRGHHAALPYKEMSEFVTKLRAQSGVTALALEYLILTAARTGEVIGAKWSEINLTEALWTVPGARMKAGHEHRVPLSKRAMAIIGQLAAMKASDFLFPGQKRGTGLSNMAMLVLLQRRMGRRDVTAHGARSAFSDWAFEVSSFSSELREKALAHSIRNESEAAYRRGDALDKRRPLMDAWARWCEPREAQNNIVQISAARA